MIVPMKKAAIIVQSADSAGALGSLRALGLLHVEHQAPPSGKDISSLKDDIAMIDRVIGILSSPALIGKSGICGVRILKDWRFTAKHILDTFVRIDHLTEYSRGLSAKIARWEKWGDFDPAALAALGEKGIHVRLVELPLKELANVPPDFIVKRIASSKTTAYCALISGGKREMPYREVVPPKMGLLRMKERFTEDDDAVRLLKETLRKYGCYLERFREIKKAFEGELEFHEALRGMGEAGKIAYIAGYIPSDRVDVLRQRAAAERWGLFVTDPSEEDAVPTLIRNPAWVAMINPVFRLLEVVPGYRELDISFWFLIFFSIFFGMLIGDAGIGMVFIALTAIAHAKFGKRSGNPSVYYLFYMLSLCAIIWGVLTGTIFGQEWLHRWIKPVMPALRDDRTVQALCFLIGAVHLSIAHVWRAILKAPSLQCLSDIGWTLILWGGFFLAKMLVLGEAFPHFGIWLFASGAVLVTLFTSPNRNILKAAGAGLGALALNIVNSFTDIVSYIRLFAVGLATVAVADAFNSMAMEVGFGNLFAGIATACILVIGQALNVVLGPMSVLVHGVRLNVLEFCSHADVKWSGFAYRPLKER